MSETRSSRISTAAVALTLAIITCSRSSLASSTLKCLAVRQNCCLGKVTLYVSERGMKYCEDAGEFEIICAPPTWTVLVFRKESREGMKIPLTDWAEHGLGIMNPKLSFAKAQTLEAQDPLLKIPCRIVSVESNRRLWRMNDPLVFQQTTKERIKLQKLVCSKSISLTSQEQLFLRGLYCIRTFGTPGIPLNLSYTCADGSINTEYSTTSIRRVELASDAFNYPQSVKLVKSHLELLLAGKRKQQLQDLAHTLVEIEAEDRKP